jgi:hypothetical protein
MTLIFANSNIGALQNCCKYSKRSMIDLIGYGPRVSHKANIISSSSFFLFSCVDMPKKKKERKKRKKV